jgi:hypothetical protein
MQWSEIPTGPSDRVLRQFAGLLAMFAVLLWWHGVAPVVLIGAIVGCLGLVRPALVRWLFVGWMMAVFPLGWVMSRIVLGLVFFGVVTPLALMFRLMGRDALELRRQPATASYWVPRQSGNNPKRYFCQY